MRLTDGEKRMGEVTVQCTRRAGRRQMLYEAEERGDSIDLVILYAGSPSDVAAGRAGDAYCPQISWTTRLHRRYVDVSVRNRSLIDALVSE